MSNTMRIDRLVTPGRLGLLTLALALASPLSHAATGVQEVSRMNVSNNAPSSNTASSTTASSNTTPAASDTLSARQQAIVPISALAAAGNITGLNAALNQGLDAGLSINEVKEVLVQLYAYAGFPRSLNALGELMKVVDARKQRGIQDAEGAAPGRSIPKGDALLAAGTANQTRLVGAPVKGPLFDFAPAADEYLKTHLFGDIFERDNLDWQSRELATLGMLSALPGAESQLQSHMSISLNVGLSAAQLRQLGQVLTDRVDADHGRRANEALDRQLAKR